MRIPFAQENGTLLSQQHIEMFYFEFFGILSVITSSPSLLPQKDKRRQYINTYMCVCVCVCMKQEQGIMKKKPKYKEDS